MDQSIIIQQDIKNRILQNIASLWGNRNIDSLDPLIKILIESLSGELFRINNNIESVEKKLIQRLSNLMIPNFFNMPSCAHAIVTALPNGSEELVESDNQFTLSIFNMPKVTFSSIKCHKLFDLSIDYLVTEGCVRRNNQNDSFENILNVNQSKINTQCAWIGIKYNSDIQSLNNLNFYFNSKDNIYLNNVLDASWYLDHNRLDANKGCTSNEQYECIDNSTINVFEKEILHYYNNFFVTISNDIMELHNNLKSNVLYPEEFLKNFSAEQLEIFTGSILWLKLEFPVSIDQSFFDNIILKVNAFPVINRALKECIHRTKSISNNIPLIIPSKEMLFSIKSVEDGASNRYTQQPILSEKEHIYRTYAINDYCSSKRFDSNVAKKHVQQLIEIVRDESAVFTSIGQDNLINLLTEIDHLLEQLNQRVNVKDIAVDESTHFISFNHLTANETIFIKYWVTNGIHANGIPAGTKLNAYKGSQFKKDSIRFLTATIGGKEGVSQQGQIDAYKYAIQTNNKIITREDIKACCLYEMKNKIQQEITIRRGLFPGPTLKDGFMRCVEVILQRSTGFMHQHPNHNWADEIQLLQSKIQMRASLNLKIIIRIE